eukprot:GHVR01079853.1.p1 GENE.GHVR01079853.1~~GHVR01079853.1.p1  ORF type:complete len:318 (-),score=46.50 GHVR01079853.1:138-1091(-)
MTKRILVTGGSGLLGYALQKHVMETAELNGNEWTFLSSKEGNLINKEECNKIFKKYSPTHVIHLAARVGGLFANLNNNLGFFRDNIIMNTNVIQSCAYHNVERAIFCLSTCAFPAEGVLPFTEENIHDGAPHSSNEGYAYAKRMLEVECRLERQHYNRDFICVIPTNLFGPCDNFNLNEAHVVPSLIHKLYLSQNNNTQLLVLGSGCPLRQFLYSCDAARILGLLLFLPKEKLNTSSVILAEETEYSIKELSELLQSCFSYTGEVNFDNTAADGIYRKTASNARLRNILPDFQFTPIRSALQDTVNWFVSNYDVARK